MHVAMHSSWLSTERQSRPQAPSSLGMSFKHTVFTSLSDEQPMPGCVWALNSAGVNSALLPKHLVGVGVPPSLSLPQPTTESTAAVPAATSMKYRRIRHLLDR